MTFDRPVRAQQRRNALEAQVAAAADSYPAGPCLGSDRSYRQPRRLDNVKRRRSSLKLVVAESQVSFTTPVGPSAAWRR